MKRNISKRAVALLVCVALCVTAAIGGTLAYIFAKTEPVINTFDPSKVACEVLAADTLLQGEGAVTVKSIGDADAYIRVAVVFTWKNSAGAVHIQRPDVSFVPQSGWFEAQGYYYYSAKVSPDAFTNALFTVAELNVDELTPPEGYELSIEFVASAIQTTAEAVADWSSDAVAIQADGTIAKK